METLPPKPHNWFAGNRGLLALSLLVALLLAAGIYAKGKDLYPQGAALSTTSKATAEEKSEKLKPEVASVKRPPAVRLIQPKSRDIVRVVGQPSFVEAYERTSIFPKVTGYIEEWNVDIGDNVKKGDVLAILYVPELREMLETKKATVKLDEQKVELARKVVKVAEANVQAAQAHLKAAMEILNKFKAQMDRWDSEVKRLRREVDRGVVDPQVLLESENQFKESKAGWLASQAGIEKAQADLLSAQSSQEQDEIAVAVAQADVKVAESEAKRLEAWVSYLTLISPYDGVITARNANTGDFVAPKVGDPTANENAPHLSPSGLAAPIYVVDRTDVVRVFVDVPERDAKFVQKNSPATVYIRAFRDQTIPAKVTRTSWALNVKSRTLRAEIDLQNTDYKDLPGAYQDSGRHPAGNESGPGKTPQILPGMYAYVKVTIEHKGIPALPSNASFAVGDKTYCWTYRDGRAQRAEIHTGLSDDKWIEVTNFRVGDADWQPVQGDEQVIVTEDLGVLAEGLEVRLKTETAEVSPEAAPPSQMP